MIVTFIIVAAGLVGATGLILGMFLGVASEKFKVEVDETEAKVRAALPGNNCGACGFPGCDGCAKAIASGAAPVNQCPVGGAPVAEKIAAIMGTDASGETADKKVAFVRCQGDCTKAKQAFHYTGIADCSDLSVVPNGSEKECPYSCCGYGTCVKACKFDAIHIVNGVAKVDKEKCVACGACVKACPKHIIDFVPYKKKHIVACQNHLKGKTVKDACAVGCIACGMCEKNCPFDAIHVIDGLAVMNDKCKDCGICAQKCPVGAITGKRPVKPAAPKAPAAAAAPATADKAAAAVETKASAPATAEKPAEQPDNTANA
ncbi:electron transport complex, RnfABCDGE type, B subunit [Lachnospiraceae bacterium JC7]|uniref:RnfABCDGE type electron transport complex subunit B n=1 Tax=Oribacterium sp. C9 TaxID=1943579 RepID=UPI0003DF01D3|nr:RnfABCDGE type electron transport complex subunit B [Oribacterium sp. C9]ETP72896.1 electron transport complex, RnfABCDGE type, B subunit [Lachnospiraceae bacterium JC7]